jgi:hypothetical protein
MGRPRLLCGLFMGYIVQTSAGSEIPPQGSTIVGTGNGTPEVPELPSAWGYSWATLSPGVINTDR